jgi:cell division protein FtsL
LYNQGTTGWLNNRAATQDFRAQALPVLPADSARELVFTGIRRLSAVPSWTILAMVILATTAVCTAVVARSRAQFRDSSQQLSRLASETESLNHENAALQVQIQRLTTDASAIELAARERLGMVRPDDVVLPIESVSFKSR